jgi:hypothetical protein
MPRIEGRFRVRSAIERDRMLRLVRELNSRNRVKKKEGCRE